MRTDEIIIRLFCMVDDTLGPVKRHPQAILHPSEIITIGLLLALKGISYRAFYRWLAAHYAPLFGRLPEQSRSIACSSMSSSRPIGSWPIRPSWASLIRSALS